MMKCLSPFQFLLFRIIFIFFLTSFYTVFSQTSDFKVQHIQDDVSQSGGTNTSFIPVGALSSAVELANNNRKTQAGPATSATTYHGNDLAGARQLTSENTLTYYRESNSENTNMRFNTSIWEYIGPANGGNELIVRGRYAVSLNASTNSVTQVLSGITNANNCIPFITGIMNNATSRNADSGTAVAYLENATTLRVQKGSNGNNVTIYITLVEFTGSNWTVLHGDSGNVSSDTGIITLRNGSDGTGAATNVSSWNDAVIFSHFRGDTSSSGVNDAISDLWPTIDPGNNNQRVDWTFDSNHDSSGSNRHFVHVLVNSDLNVTRFQDNSSSAGENNINITSAGLSDINQAFIVGFSISRGKGTAYGRGWRNYYLKSTTEAAHWTHRSGNPMSHEIQIIDLSGLQTSYVGPEINILGNGNSIPDGNTAISLTDFTSFGDIEATGAVSVTHSFTIQNLGSTNLTLDDPSPFISITGATADFTLVANPTTPISAGGNTTFTITYDPTTSGTHLATVSIANNDTDEDPYTFLIQGIGEYCASNGSDDYDTSVTYVSFNTISNASGKGVGGIQDFTDISTNVYRNSTHDLTVNINSDGNWTIFTRVWIDWNRDADFDDPGEEYDLGSATNVTDGPTTGSPFEVTVPFDAQIGSTTMRIATKWLEYPSSCDEGFDGEVEDYSINVIDYLVDFNGVDEYIDMADNFDLTSSFSMESWVLQESTVANGTIISKGNIDATLKAGYHLTLQNNYPNLTWYDNSNNEVLNITSPYLIPNNEWHHIATTYDGVLARLYVDGIEVISGLPSAAPIDTPQNFKIGAETANYSSSPLQINFFDGAILETRIWDVALSENQIREMMNQHIEKNGLNVKGTIVPLNISGGLLWVDLLGYYPLNSNTAFDSSDNSIDGIPHEIDSSQKTTAPLPYETDIDSSWDTPATWLYNNDVYIPNTLGVDSITIIDWNIVEISNNIASGDRNVSLLGMIQTGGTLTIADPVVTTPVEKNTGQGLTISHYLELDGVIDLVGESQLVQSEGSIIDIDSGGYIERDQQGAANGFNYNYWSSSVGPIGGNSSSRGTGISSVNTSHTLAGVLNDGTSSSSYESLAFNPSYSSADSDTPSLPRTISTYWLYTFYGESDNYYAWEKIDQTSDLLPGEGFTMKGTSGAVPIADEQNYVFKGLPNNGDISLPLDRSSGEVERLIGNPYPSAMDATEFILDNMSIADGGNNPTETVFNGALYFWDHFGKEDSHYLAEYVGGYATRNLIGGSIAISNDSRINNTSNAGNPAEGTKVPGQFIAVNQGFFVNTTLAGYNNDNGVPIATVDGGTIVFKNRQRVYATEDGSTSLFFKSTKGKTAKINSTKSTINNTPLIRLMYDSPLGYHRQLVLGENINASTGFDLGYDAFMVDINKEDMYWLLNNGKFVIQGVHSFDDAQRFPIGLIVKKSGLVSLRLDALENVDPNKIISIKDNITGEVFEINKSPFQVHLTPGNYSDRFELVFQSNESSNELLNSQDVNALSSEVLVYMDSEASVLKLINKTNLHLTTLDVFNILGQNVKSLYIDSFKSEFIPIQLSTGAYIVNLQTEKGVLSKKVIVK